MAFLSDAHQPEVEFLHPWAVVWVKQSGESSVQEKRHSAIQIC